MTSDFSNTTPKYNFQGSESGALTLKSKGITDTTTPKSNFLTPSNISPNRK